MSDELPKLSELYLPILKVLKNSGILHRTELKERVRDEYNHLPHELLQQEVKSGGNKLLTRIGWATVDLKFAKLIEYPQRGMRGITDKGEQILKKEEINLLEDQDYLDYWDGVEKRRVEKNANADVTDITPADVSPQDLIDAGIAKIESTVKAELLDRLKSHDPYDFEKIVLKLLDKMGYGEAIETKKSNDGGIDGIVKEDHLGISKIYMQAKRFGENKVSERYIRDFIAAMSGEAKKGVFVTTSTFDNKAIEKAKSSDPIIILIDGAELVDLMYQFGIGVQTQNSYEVKDIDENFFN